MFVYQPDKATTFYDEPKLYLPVLEFAQDFSLTVEDLFNCLLE